MSRDDRSHVQTRAGSTRPEARHPQAEARPSPPTGSELRDPLVTGMPADGARHAASPVAGMHLADLQRSAGNRAVSSLLLADPRLHRRVIQRFPTASPDVVDPVGDAAIGANLGIAERDLAAAGFLAGQLSQARAAAGTVRTADPALTPAVLIEKVWRLPAASTDVPKDLRTRYAAVRQKTTQQLTQLYAPLVAGAAVTSYLATPSVRAALQTIVDGLHASSPSFEVFATAEDLWEHWLRLAPAESLGNGGGSDQRKPLRAALDSMAESWADTFSGFTHGQHQRPAAITPQADPAADEIAAVAGAIRARPTWVGESDMAGIATTVADTLKRPVADVRAALPRWLIHAERDLIGSVGLTKPSPAVWAYARSMYASTLDLPVWRYYDERIVNFDLFGNKMWGKQGGVNRDVLPTLRLVEQEATRMAGVQTVAALKFAAAEWGGFRFEPQKADLANKRHVSYHATGLAIDFRVQTNNVITGPATELLDAIATQGGSAFTTRSIAKADTPTSAAQTNWANEVQAHLRRRDELQAQVTALTPATAPAGGGSAGATGTAAAGAGAAGATGGSAGAEGKDAAGSSGTGGDAGTDATPATDATGTAATPVPANPELVKAQGLLAAEEAWLAKVGQQSSATTLGTSGETIRTHLEAVESAFQASFRQHFGDRPVAPEHETPADKTARLNGRRDALAKGWPAMRDDIRQKLAPDALKAFDAQFPEKPAPVTVLQTLDPFLDQGLTDQPSWMVGAFTSLGWRWGGGWHDPLDAMHFDFMGTIDGVRN